MKAETMSLIIGNILFAWVIYWVFKFGTQVLKHSLEGEILCDTLFFVMFEAMLIVVCKIIKLDNE